MTTVHLTEIVAAGLEAMVTTSVRDHATDGWRIARATCLTFDAFATSKCRQGRRRLLQEDARGSRARRPPVRAHDGRPDWPIATAMDWARTTSS